MKKILSVLLLAVAMLGVRPVSAQSLDFGVTGGLNLTKISFKNDLKDNFKSENQAGWYLGVKAQATLFMGFGLDASLYYSQQKLYIEEKDDHSGSYETARSIAIPVNLRYNIGLGSVASVFIATGPQFDFNIGNKSFGLFDSDGNMFERENMTTSWNIGGGVKLLGHLEANVTYNFAISKLGKNLLEIGDEMGGVDIPIGDTDLKSNTFKVGLTYYF